MQATILNPHSGKAVSSIALGSRVTLKADLNSPVMTCITPLAMQGTNDIIGWLVGWFNTTYSSFGDDAAIAKTWNTAQFPIECLELASEVVQ